MKTRMIALKSVSTFAATIEATERLRVLLGRAEPVEPPLRLGGAQP